MLDIFQDPLYRAAILPFGGTVILALVVRVLGGADLGRHYTGAVVGAVFLWVCGMVLGIPEFPPRADSSAVAYILLIAWVLGLGLDLLERLGYWNSTFEFVILAILGAGIIWWLNGADLEFLTRGTEGLTAAIIYMVWLLLAGRFRTVSKDAHIPAIMMTITATGVGIAAWIAVLPADSELAFGLASALLGFFVLNLPGGRNPFSSSLLLAGSAALLVISIRLLQTVDISGIALLILVLIGYADTVSKHADFGPRFAQPVIKILALILLSAIPVALTAAATLVEMQFQPS